MKAARAKKQALRGAWAALKASRQATGSTKACATFACLDAVPASAEFTKADLDAVKQSVAAVAEPQREDKLDELSSQQQMLLQQLMDRQSKLETILSNVMKATNDTAGTLTENLK